LVLTTAGVVATGYRMIVTGSLTLDVGWGRNHRPLGPVLVQIAAPPDVVHDVLSRPYLGRTPRSLASKLEVLEKGYDMVLAAHYTPTTRGLIATTVETVRFPAADRIEFRLVRGPVPYVRETFILHVVDGGTELEYSGELGTDFWAIGRWWGNQVARKWEAAVNTSLAAVKSDSERRAQHLRPSPS
jgi:hypothetical protein